MIVEFIFRWAHVLFGITWIGLLYYFNFVQTEYFKEAEASAKADAMKKLAPRALWWFRWGAMFTLLTGLVLLHFIGADRDIAEWALRMTGGWAFRDRIMSELSGGERQLVLIARALAQKPLLLMLDEPIAHLDIGHQVDVLDLLRRLNRDMGLTIVMVLHDLNLAAEYSHVLALLHEGRIHTIGQPAEVIEYHTIEEVYKTVVVVGKNPVSAKPYVLPVPEAQRAQTAPRDLVREGS